MTADDYLELVAWSGGCVQGSPGAAHHVAVINDAGARSRDQWDRLTRHLRRFWWRAVGDPDALRGLASRLGQRWLKGCREIPARGPSSREISATSE
jgi:hypothetical protein